jgi:capsular polysaccharide export protein
MNEHQYMTLHDDAELHDRIDQRVFVFSTGIQKIPFLESFFDARFHVLYKNFSLASQHSHFKPNDLVATWGRKANYNRDLAFSVSNNIGLLTLEDGFIRSLGGGASWAPCSMVMDYKGIYFDAYRESDLESMINSVEDFDRLRSRRCIDFICAHKISKYNDGNLKDFSVNRDFKNILVIDQTFNDQSIAYGGADANSFERMLAVAIESNPNGLVWVKIHPEVLEKSKTGYLAETLQSSNVRVIKDKINPYALMRSMDDVYVVTSNFGFEALLLGKNVFCFGMPWYAGWGLTNDSYAPVSILNGRRKSGKTIEHLFYCAYIRYSRYVYPITGLSCEIETVLYWMKAGSFWNDRLRGKVMAVGFSPWKKYFLKDFFDLPSVQLEFIKKPRRKKDSKSSYLVWGSKYKKEMMAFRQVWRLEDGFVRSSGLGAKLIRPMSLVLDPIGIYYDATSSSYIEHILSNCLLDSVDRVRVESLINTIVSLSVSKYNVGGSDFWPVVPKNKKIILVAGQVEGDASIQYGGVDIFTNRELLVSVRRHHPDDYIVYKPHPDVHAGLRSGHIAPALLSDLCDVVVEDVDMATCLANVDEVHVLTSLTGFEALIRQIPVVCYGLPFYAGWGLTTDRHGCERRIRQLTLEQLVYGALIETPLYKIPNRSGFATVEDVIAHITGTSEAHASDRLSLIDRLWASFSRIFL